jgi:hypothetical protein
MTDQHVVNPIIRRSRFDFNLTTCGPLLLLLSYTAMVLLALYNHEPWGDEADTWLQARDLDVLPLIKMSAYHGHPSLWLLTQEVMHNFGLTFSSIFVINLLFTLGAVSLFLYKFPFSIWTKIPVIFSYFWIYEYSVNARNYSLGIFLLFLLCCQFSTRAARPILYGITLALLANSLNYFFFFAGFMALEWCCGEQAFFKTTRGRIGGVMAALGILFSLYSLWPASDAQFGDGPVHFVKFEGLINVTKGMIFPIGVDVERLIAINGLSTWQMAIQTAVGTAVVACTIYLLIHLYKSLAAVFFATFAAILYINTLIHSGTARHHGLVLMILMACLWMAKTSVQAKTQLSLNQKSDLNRLNVFVMFVALNLIPTIYTGMRAIKTDVRNHASGSVELANYIQKEKLNDREIITLSSFMTMATIAILDHDGFFDAPRLRRTSFHPWDQTTVPVLFADKNEVLREVIQKRRDLFVAELPALVVSPEPIDLGPYPKASLIFKTAGDSFRPVPENLFLYQIAM